MIVADTSPLIFLARLDLLDLFLTRQPVIAPVAVVEEATQYARQGGAQIRHAVLEGRLGAQWPRQEELVFQLAAKSGHGEAAAVVLASELGCRVLVDDQKGRAIAELLGVEAFGTLAVLIALHRDGHIEDLGKTLTRLIRLGFYMSPKLRQKVLDQV